MPRFLRYAITAAAGIFIGAVVILATLKLSGVHAFDRLLGNTRSAGSAAEQDLTSPEAFSKYAYKVLGYIKSKDFEALSEQIHPEYGVVFSPSATISLSSGKCFSASQVADFGGYNGMYIWGVYDSGSPIELTPNEYFDRFLTDRDYTRAPVIGVDYVVKTGNALENMAAVFPDVRFVEFHFPGDESQDYLNWSTLRLGFEPYNGTLKLTVILRSVWTA